MRSHLFVAGSRGYISGMSQENPTEATITAWARLIRARQLVVDAVEREVKAAGLIPLEWYDVLLELSRAPEGGLRPFELEGRLLLAQYNLSRLTDRLVKAGYVEKRPCDRDGRGHVLAITEAGREVRKNTWPLYAKAIQRHVGAKLRPGDAETLGEILAQLVDSKFGGICGRVPTDDVVGEAERTRA
jgi:DNA-binding MarR family transcriptional regulator